MKRSVILTLCIILCLALTLGGTIAYLSDSDGDVNVMTLGQVNIEIEEFQRDGNGGLTGYVDGQFLYPQVENTITSDQFGLPIDPTFHDKIVRVRSTARNANAYLRVWIGVPTAMLNVAEEQDAVHLVWGGGVRLGDETGSGWNWEAGGQVETTIDHVPYTMLCYNYTKLLEPDEVTAPLLAGLYLDKRVDNSDNPDDGYTMWIDGVEYPIDCDLSQGLQVTVLAQAVQADGFDHAAQAFRESGMDDVDFDKELNLEFIVRLEAAVQRLVDRLNDRLAAGLEPYEPLTADLESTTYTIDAAAAAALNDVAAQVNGDTQVDLWVGPGEDITVNLTDAPLADNIGVVNNGGTLTITGSEN